MDGFAPTEGGNESSASQDPFNLSALMSFNSYTELLSPSAPDQVFASFGFSGSPWTFFQSPNAPAQAVGDFSTHSGGVPLNSRDKAMLQRSSFQFRHSLNAPDANDRPDENGDCSAINDISKERSRVISKPIGGVSLPEKMLKVLALFKESSSGGILAQVWMPVKHGDDYMLSTSEQPYLLDQILSGYRDVSRAFMFSLKEAPGYYLGLPGRVFISCMPEWTSNVVYYNKLEYLRADYAVNHHVRGSLAVPVFDRSKHSCCAVLELVTTEEKPDFDTEMDIMSDALLAVGLRTIKTRVQHQMRTKSKESAITEILDVLRAVCHAHMLPLALTWVPFSYDNESSIDKCTRDVFQEGDSSLRKKNILRIQESACYVNDARMQGFLHACAEHHLENGQGIAGKALKSNHPFFSPDVKGYDVRDYPLAHHARKFNLQAAVAIRLRSTFTKRDDYILEFYLPVNCRGSSEQQLLLNNLSSTMQRISKSLRTVSDAEVSETDDEKARASSPSTIFPSKNFQEIDSDTELTSESQFEIQDTGSDERGEVAHHGKMKSGLLRQLERKRSTSEKNISLSVLQMYFSGSLKDAAKSVGVCPTTLKRICRQHGISRWPSRKINKVNRSLKKIQTVIDSVQGVEGTIKYDPATGNLVAEVTSAEKPTTATVELSVQDAKHVSCAHLVEPGQFVGKLEADENLCDRHQVGISEQLKLPDAHDVRRERAPVSQIDCKNKCQNASLGGLSHQFGGLSQQLGSENTQTWALNSKDGPHGSYASNERCKLGAFGKGGLSLESIDCQLTCRGSSSMVMSPIDETNNNVGAIDRLGEHSHISSSGMTDSSSGSASSCPTFIKHSTSKTFTPETGPAITVKASYREDTVRFKFLPSMGCHQLYEEIARRFKLSIGTFQIKYMDDEKEWVILSNDSDLQECIEILDSGGSCNAKLQVRDVPCAVGSSASSNCFLTET